MGVIKRQKVESADDSFEITYISLMLLLFCFMVIMVSLAHLEGPRFRKAIGSVRGAFSLLSEASQTSMVADGGPGVLTEDRARKRDDFADRLRASLEAMLGPGMENLVKVEVEESCLVLTMGNLLLYEPGRSGLRPEAIPIVEEVGRMLVSWPGRVRVTGHTCDLPISTEVFPSNWDLSVARAVEVVKHLERAGVDGKRLLAAGMGASQPLLPNDSEEHRVFNRRVEVILEYAGGVSSICKSSEDVIDQWVAALPDCSGTQTDEDYERPSRW